MSRAVSPYVRELERAVANLRARIEELEPAVAEHEGRLEAIEEALKAGEDPS